MSLFIATFLCTCKTVTRLSRSIALPDWNGGRGELRKCKEKEKREEVRNSRGWREQGDSPAAKESAGSVVGLFIILSLVTATCGPLYGRREKKRGKREEDWVRNRWSDTEREAVSLKKNQNGNDHLLCSPDVRLCAGLPVQAFGTGPAWWSPLTAQGEQLCTGSQFCCSQLRCGTNRYRSLFTHGQRVCIMLVYLLSVYVLFLDDLPWQLLFCMVIIFWSLKRLADDGPPEVLWVHATMSIFKRQLHFIPLIGQDCTWCLFL